MTVSHRLRPCLPSDLDTVVALKERAMRDELTRLGVWNAERSRARVEAAFAPDRTSFIEVDGAVAGCVSVRDEPDGHWVELFYLDEAYRGSGLGSAVLTELIERHGGSDRPMRLDVLQGSRARALYERHGFVHDSEDPVDVFLARPPGA